ncbi:hypothetical protein [Staphylococcus shinii]|uniref:hypothetical protein n=1 Tax=Staphylococcus shinii TaxID=2912228 RepID=UPI003CEF88BB
MSKFKGKVQEHSSSDYVGNIEEVGSSSSEVQEHSSDLGRCLMWIMKLESIFF